MRLSQMPRSANSNPTPRSSFTNGIPKSNIKRLDMCFTKTKGKTSKLRALWMNKKTIMTQQFQFPI